MKIIILLVVFLVAGALVFDAKRKKKDAAAKTSSERIISANEAPPTETGRMRISEIVEAIKKDGVVPQSGVPSAEEVEKRVTLGTVQSEEESDALPDPFAEKKND